MLTLIARDVRKAASAVVAAMIVSFGLLLLDHGHSGTIRDVGIDGNVMPSSVTTAVVVSLPEVVVVGKRPGACVTPPSRTSSPYPRCAW